MLLQNTVVDAEGMQIYSSNEQRRKSHKNFIEVQCNEDASLDAYQFYCSQCGFGCISRWELQKHTNTEHFSTNSRSALEPPNSIKSHVCEICGYGSVLKDHLRRHLRIHTGERPFKCELCPYSTNQQNNLTRHERVHDCGSCSFRSADKQVLQQHREMHSFQ